MFLVLFNVVFMKFVLDNESKAIFFLFFSDMSLFYAKITIWERLEAVTIGDELIVTHWSLVTGAIFADNRRWWLTSTPSLPMTVIDGWRVIISGWWPSSSDNEQSMSVLSGWLPSRLVMPRPSRGLFQWRFFSDFFFFSGLLILL